MPGRAGAAVGGGGAQHTPPRCPGLCRTSPRGESSLSGQPPVLVASACLGLSGLRPLSSVSLPCVFRGRLQGPSLSSPCSLPIDVCVAVLLPPPGALASPLGVGRQEQGGLGLPSAGGREETWARRAPGARWAVCGPGRLRHRSVLLYSGSGPPSPAAQAALLPPPRCCSPNGQGHAGPRQTATTVEWRSPGRGRAWQPAERVPSHLRAAGLLGRGREWGPRTPPSA